MTKLHHVLLVEDNVPDIVLARKALAVLSPLEVTVAVSVDEAWDVLDRIGVDLVLLDLNLPKVSGFELLRRLKASEKRHVPVVVVTSSAAEDDIRRAYDAGASGYLIKPLSLRQYQELAGKLGAYWLQACCLPAR